MNRGLKRVIAGALALVSLALVASCGKVGPPVPPGPPSQITYPRTYPTH